MDVMRLMSGLAMLAILVFAYVGGKDNRMVIKIPFLIASFTISVVIAKYFAHHYVATQNAATYVLVHITVMLLFIIGVVIGSFKKEK